MGKHKRSAVAALERLCVGAEVVAVVAPEPTGDEHESQRLDTAAGRLGLRLATDDELYDEIEAGTLGEVDLVLSFLFWKRIRPPLIELARVGCLNFHPAPLPDIRGIGGYNVAILENFAEWGVSAHFVDEDFDTGDLIRVDRFPIDESETAFSLDLRSQERLLEVYRGVIDMALARQELPREPQGDGRYVTREEFEAMRKVGPDDPPELTERRIRAFWYPPFDGATIELGGRNLTLVDRSLLAQAAAANRDAGLLP